MLAVLLLHRAALLLPTWELGTRVPDQPGLGTLSGLPPQARVAEPREMHEKNIVAVMIMIRMPVTHRIETKRKCPWKLPAPHTRARLYRSLVHLAFNLNLSEWHSRAIPGKVPRL